jgi:hypothetical protein
MVTMTEPPDARSVDMCIWLTYGKVILEYNSRAGFWQA